MTDVELIRQNADVMIEQTWDGSGEDCTTIRTPLSEWVGANAEDEECISSIPRLLDGEEIWFGGSAAPFCRVGVAR